MLNLQRIAESAVTRDAACEKLFCGKVRPNAFYPALFIYLFIYLACLKV